MKNQSVLLLIVLIQLLTLSCSTNQPKVELKNSKVYLHNFTYIRGISGPTSVTTNAEKFDKLIWDEFKETTGTYDLVYYYEEKDQYGNLNKSEVPFGRINLSEIRKYRTYEDFKNGDGFFKIIEK